MSYPHGWFQLVGLKAATNSTSFSSRHGGWTSQDGDTSWCQELGTHLEEFGFEYLKDWMFIAWFASWGCGCHQVLFGHSLMTTVIGTAISMGLIRCYLQQPSTISHPEPESFMVFMIWFWLPTISSCQRSEQLTPGTLAASHPASSWIKMVLPPSWDHFKMWRVARMFTNRWTWNHPLQALFIPKISQLHPVATILFEILWIRIFLCQNIRGTSGITLLAGAPARRTKPCQGCWPWRYFLDRPSHICSGHGGRIDVPLNIIICICTVFEPCLDLGAQFFRVPPCQVWRFRGAIGANVERKLCAVLFLCVFFTRREITCHWQRVEPTNDFPAAQFLAQLCFVYFHSPRCFPFGSCQREPWSCFLQR